MPTYDYKCDKCGHKFELHLSVSQHQHKQKCPKCGSVKVEQLITPFNALTGKKA